MDRARENSNYPSLSWFCPFPSSAFSISSGKSPKIYPISVPMKKSTATLYAKSHKETSYSSSTDENVSRGSNYIIYPMEDRLFCLKIEEIMAELTQIMSFMQELESLWFTDRKTLSQIHAILKKLRSGDRTYKYTEIVHILTKYLSGMRNFASTIHIKNILSYKKLFESTLVAIIREIDDL